MTENFIKKVIRASAGTGKTYRLSLEYIGLLLKFRGHGIRFSEILVITFTRKATAEIRERIFKHLEDIINQSADGIQLVNNLNSILRLTVTADDIDYLRRVYHEMLLNKNLVQISTIDSFTNAIFKTIISPYLGLATYDINETIDPEVMAEIYQHLLQDHERLDAIRSFFARAVRRKIEDYESFIVSIIDNRWLFHLIQELPGAALDEQEREKLAAHWCQQFQETFYRVLDTFEDYVGQHYAHVPVADLFKKNFYHYFTKRNDSYTLTEFIQKVKQHISEPSAGWRTDDHSAFWRIVTEHFWNGTKLFRKKEEQEFAIQLKEDLAHTQECLAEFIFYDQLLLEQTEIMEIAQLILSKYDELKFRDRVFTYNDISYYTFKYLYDPALSLIDHDLVTNAFYEYLTAAIRFILIDEFQDTSIIQMKILMPIIKEVISGFGVKDYGGAIVVGDEKQSIYGWRGGERDLLLNMPLVLDGAEEVTLDTSYRSEACLIDFINQIFTSELLHNNLEQQGIRWHYQQIQAQKKSTEGYIQVNFYNYSSAKGEDNAITPSARGGDAIREFIEQIVSPIVQARPIAPKSTAILARKNKDLRYMASILDEMGIDYVLESTSSILHHRAIKPLLYLFQFLVYRDVVDLLKFLRSDMVLLESHFLKEILRYWREHGKDAAVLENLLKDLSHIPAIAKLTAALKKANFPAHGKIEANEIPYFDLLHFIKIFFEEYHAIQIFHQDNDVKNINRFLEIVVQFQKTQRSYPGNLKGFLDYCCDNEDHESLQQAGLEQIQAISLMSIHKAKGLEFEDVFLYWNLSGRSGSNHGRLHSYSQYTADYRRLQNWCLTCNFDHILATTHERSLKQVAEHKESIEELNNFYVAVTRAKKNLFIFLSYQKAGGIEKLFELAKESEQMPVDRLLAWSIYENVVSKNLLQGESSNKAYAAIGSIRTAPQEKQPQPADDFSFIKDYIDPDRTKHLARDEKRISAEEHLDFKSVYILHKNIERGNVVHYYLSFIYHATADELSFAWQRTLSFYGNLLPKEELSAIIDKVNEFIRAQHALFSAEKWTKIFTEYTIFSAQGKELRLDRLMIDEQRKEILVIDYKAGEIYEQDQIQQYVDAVKAMVPDRTYQVHGEYRIVPV